MSSRTGDRVVIDITQELKEVLLEGIQYNTSTATTSLLRTPTH